MIEVKNLSLSYGDKQVLENFSLTIPRRGVIGFTGPSGSGKTSLLRRLAGLERSGGTVSGLSEHQTAFLFQENRLLPWRTVEQHITDVLPRDRRGETERWLALAELEGENKALPAELSGGMARRLAVARCAALGGEVLLLDEPFTGVDTQRAVRMLTALKNMGTPVILVSHEEPVLEVCDKVYTFDGPPLRLVSER